VALTVARPLARTLVTGRLAPPGLAHPGGATLAATLPLLAGLSLVTSAAVGAATGLTLPDPGLAAALATLTLASGGPPTTLAATPPFRRSTVVDVCRRVRGLAPRP